MAEEEGERLPAVADSDPCRLAKRASDRAGDGAFSVLRGAAATGNSLSEGE